MIVVVVEPAFADRDRALQRRDGESPRCRARRRTRPRRGDGRRRCDRRTAGVSSAMAAARSAAAIDSPMRDDRRSHRHRGRGRSTSSRSTSNAGSARCAWLSMKSHTSEHRRDDRGGVECQRSAAAGAFGSASARGSLGWRNLGARCANGRLVAALVGRQSRGHLCSIQRSSGDAT